mgnify:CR=1 FL=1
MHAQASFLFLGFDWPGWLLILLAFFLVRACIPGLLLFFAVWWDSSWVRATSDSAIPSVLLAITANKKGVENDPHGGFAEQQTCCPNLMHAYKEIIKVSQGSLVSE